MATMMVYLIVGFSLGVVVLQVVTSYLAARKPIRIGASELRLYRRRPSLLPEQERDFFNFLAESLRPALVVLPEVPLDRVIESTATGGRGLVASNKLRGLHVPFLLCEPVSLRPMGVALLEHPSGFLGRGRDTESLLEPLLAEVGIPVVRVNAAPSYEVQEIRNTVRQALWK
ncbi:MAG: hypothetical protein RLZZ303_434 [Candidatus Hydrogenedentota bacterium]|jgi:hypothetical protein